MSGTTAAFGTAGEREHQRDDAADGEEHEDELHFLRQRHLLVDLVADVEADDRAALRDAAEGGGVSVIVAVLGVEELRDVVHEELRVREQHRLRDEHQPKSTERNAGDRRRRLAGRLLGAHRRRGRRARAPLVDAQREEQRLHRQHRHAHLPPAEARRQQLAEDDVSDRRAEARRRGAERELRRLARRVVLGADNLHDRAHVTVYASELSSHAYPKMSTAMKVAVIATSQITRPNQHDPAAEPVRHRRTEQLAAEAHERHAPGSHHLVLELSAKLRVREHRRLDRRHQHAPIWLTRFAVKRRYVVKAVAEGIMAGSR